MNSKEKKQLVPLNSLPGYARQTGAVYMASEIALYKESASTKEIVDSPSDFKSEKELVDYAEGIRTGEFVRKHWNRAAVAFRPEYSLTKTTSFFGGIGAETNIEERALNFANNGFGASKSSVLHELAHLILADEYGIDFSDLEDHLGHGPTFVRIHLMLVREFLGNDIAEKYELELRKFGARIADEKGLGKMPAPDPEILSRLLDFALNKADSFSEVGEWQ